MANFCCFCVSLLQQSDHCSYNFYFYLFDLQVAIKIIDKTQLNSSSLQKVRADYVTICVLLLW